MAADGSQPIELHRDDNRGFEERFVQIGEIHLVFGDVGEAFWLVPFDLIELLCSYNLIAVNTSLARGGCPVPARFLPSLGTDALKSLKHLPLSGAVMIDPKPMLLL